MRNLKTEKEKMLSGNYYFASDKELVKERDDAKKLMYEFNNTEPHEKEKKREIMSNLIKAQGSFHINTPFHCDYGYNIQVGDNFYANFNCIFLDVNKIIIGDNALLGPNVQIYTAGHPLDPVERVTGIEFGKPVVIGDNVWIGGGAIICPGVTIGHNVVIGAGSVVTKDIPDHVVAAGNPCKVIRAL